MNISRFHICFEFYFTTRLVASLEYYTVGTPKFADLAKFPMTP